MPLSSFLIPIIDDAGVLPRMTPSNHLGSQEGEKEPLETQPRFFVRSLSRCLLRSIVILCPFFFCRPKTSSLTDPRRGAGRSLATVLLPFSRSRGFFTKFSPFSEDTIFRGRSRSSSFLLSLPYARAFCCSAPSSLEHLFCLFLVLRNFCSGLFKRPPPGSFLPPGLE